MNMTTIVFLIVAILIVVPMIFKVMREYQRAVVFTFGRFTSVKGPGLIIIIPLVQQIERVDLRTIVPLDRETVLKSVAKTGLAVIADECHRSFGVAAEIAAILAEDGLASLKAPVCRVAVPDVPIPFSPPLEAELTVTAEKIAAGVLRVLDR